MASPATERALPDRNGHPIKVGSIVRQWNVYDPDGGALQANALKTGKVTAVLNTRVEVNFQREAMYGFRGSGELASPIRIRANYVEVVQDPLDEEAEVR